jgi:hypothetical protein
MFVFLFGGCSTVNTASLNNQLNLTATSTPIAQNSPDGEGRIIKEAGWQVPAPKEKKKIRTNIISMAAEDGRKVDVSITEYVHEKDVLYTETPVPGTTLVRGALRLANFSELKVKEKIFLYTIFARPVRPQEESNDNSSHDHMFVYQIVDRNGDSIFETLLIGKSKFLVPNWALE